MPVEISFVYEGDVPSKSNYRNSRRPVARAQWTRIKDYQAEIRRLAEDAGGADKATGGRVSISLTAYNQRPDLDNIFKATIDAMKGVCYPDDAKRYIRRLSIEDKSDDGGQRLRVLVRWDTRGDQEQRRRERKRRSNEHDDTR